MLFFWQSPCIAIIVLGENNGCWIDIWIILPFYKASVMILVKTNNIFLYALIYRGTVVALYAFRNTPVTYAPDNKRALECFCVLTSCKNQSTLLAGFTMALIDMTKQHKFVINYVLVEDHADAFRLIQPLKKTQPVFFTSPTAFFFYNYACYSAKSQNVLILYWHFF